MKFHKNVKIPQKRANSAAQLKIPQPTENWALLISWGYFQPVQHWYCMTAQSHDSVVDI